MTRSARPFLRRLAADQRGAVAATYALALVPLIAVAGVGMDYARLMGMDSELQNGADQAALAAASQLDGRAGACERAAIAARTLVANESLLTSDANAITVASETACDASGSIRFWQDKAKTNAATTDANARFVEVSVGLKSVDYALLPVTGLMSADNIGGTAFAGLGSAICKQPPLMLCNPLETGANKDFDAVAHIGKGVRLMANDGSGIAPGNFGFLETNAGTGASVLLEVLARQDRPGDCVATENVTTETGVKASVMDAFNTRFGIYGNGLNQACGSNGQLCPPSVNSRNDLQYKSCSGASPFDEGSNPYRPNSIAPVDPTGLDPMGYPRDMCHAVTNEGVCAGGPLGDGSWDRNAYFRTNSAIYPDGAPATSLMSSYGDPRTPSSVKPTRFQVYKYESANAAKLARQGNFQGSPICNAPGISPSGPTPDRRVLSVAVINCQQEGVGGKTSGVDVLKFVDVFLVEPSLDRGAGKTKRTEKTDLYVEVIGETTLGGGAAQGQNVRRDVPYLIE